MNIVKYTIGGESNEIAIAGTGYVGLVTGVCLAEVGHTNVVCVDIDNKKVNLMKNGVSPIHEANLEELMIEITKEVE